MESQFSSARLLDAHESQSSNLEEPTASSSVPEPHRTAGRLPISAAVMMDGQETMPARHIQEPQAGSASTPDRSYREVRITRDKTFDYCKKAVMKSQLT